MAAAEADGGYEARRLNLGSYEGRCRTLGVAAAKAESKKLGRAELEELYAVPRPAGWAGMDFGVEASGAAPPAAEARRIFDERKRREAAAAPLEVSVRGGNWK